MKFVLPTDYCKYSYFNFKAKFILYFFLCIEIAEDIINVVVSLEKSDRNVLFALADESTCGCCSREEGEHISASQRRR